MIYYIFIFNDFFFFVNFYFFFPFVIFIFIIFVLIFVFLLSFFFIILYERLTARRFEEFKESKFEIQSNEGKLDGE